MLLKQGLSKRTADRRKGPPVPHTTPPKNEKSCTKSYPNLTIALFAFA